MNPLARSVPAGGTPRPGQRGSLAGVPASPARETGGSYVAHLDALLKGNRLEDAARYAHDIAEYAKRRHSIDSAQSQLFEAYRDDIKNLRYVHLTDEQMEAELAKARELQKVNEAIKTEILSSVMDEIEGPAAK